MRKKYLQQQENHEQSSSGFLVEWCLNRNKIQQIIDS